MNTPYWPYRPFVSADAFIIGATCLWCTEHWIGASVLTLYAVLELYGAAGRHEKVMR